MPACTTYAGPLSFIQFEEMVGMWYVRVTMTLRGIVRRY